MHYPDGQEVRLGDRVQLGLGAGGIVVASIDTNDYGAEYPGTEWSNLKKGVLIHFPGTYGLIHYEEPEPDLRLVARAPIREKEGRPSRG